MILLTGFEPFGGETANPSWAAARCGGTAAPVRRAEVAGGGTAVRLRRCRPRCWTEALERFTPGACAVRRPGRRQGAHLAGTDGHQLRRRPDPGQRRQQPRGRARGPRRTGSLFHVAAGQSGARGVDRRADPGRSVPEGRDLCLQPRLLRAHARPAAAPGTSGGFVHVPYADTQLPAGSSAPSLPADQMAAALAVVVRTALATTADLRLAAGATH